MIRRTLLAAAVATAAAGAGWAAAEDAPALGGAPDGAGSGPPSLAALRAARDASVARLDAAWGDAVNMLVSAMGRDPRAEPAWRALQRSQELWTAHRDAECREAAPARLGDLAGRRAALACEAAKNAARAAELASRYVTPR